MINCLLRFDSYRFLYFLLYKWFSPSRYRSKVPLPARKSTGQKICTADSHWVSKKDSATRFESSHHVFWQERMIILLHFCWIYVLSCKKASNSSIPLHGHCFIYYHILPLLSSCTFHRKESLLCFIFAGFMCYHVKKPLTPASPCTVTVLFITIFFPCSHHVLFTGKNHYFASFLLDLCVIM